MSTPLSKRGLACVVLTLIFFRELARSSWSVAKASFARNLQFSPAVIAVPLRLKTDAGITMLANLVSLTPGTTSLHVSEDRSVLYVHCLDVTSVEDVISDIQYTFERILMEIEG